MKRYLFLLFLLALALDLSAQQLSDYNRKGDDAMKRKDYTDAKMWYEEGVSRCDSYSIGKLTQFWLLDSQMHPSMRSLMDKCLNCLTVKANENDTTAITQLILYYSEGIGTSKNDDLAAYWKDQKEKLLHPVIVQTPPTEVEKHDTIITEVRPEKTHFDFFLGYAYSPQAPYGLTFGSVGKHIGWYVRFKTNMKFRDFTDKCNDKGEILNFSNADSQSYNATGQKQSNTFAGTVGIVFRCAPWLFITTGAGYGQRSLLYSFTTHNYDNFDNQAEIWCKNTDSSYKGIAAECDVMLKFGSFFISSGCSTINFKYVDLNAGAGVFF